MRKIITIFILSIGLFSCTSSKMKQEITVGNWFAVGEFDGNAGFIKKSEASLQKLNSKYSEKALDHTAYLDGYKQGLQTYCQPNNGYVVGAQGLPYRNVCQKLTTGNKFYQEWLRGRASKAP